MQHFSFKVIIGLGNPGQQYYHTRHNIGFRILDKLAQLHNVSWQHHTTMDVTRVLIDGKTIILIKPLTFMNNSGNILSWVHKQGIEAKDILVVHDDLDLPFGNISLKHGGSARGHNGVKSIIAAGGEASSRLRFGIDRPGNRDDVPQYVLEKFQENPEQVEHAIDKAIQFLDSLLQQSPGKS